MKKRILSMLLAIVMVVGLLPTVALAGEPEEDDSSPDLWVGGVEMTSGHYLAMGATETTDIQPDGGYAHYAVVDGNPTLTLDNFSYSGAGKENAAIFYFDPGYSDSGHPLNIVLVGTNSVTHTGGNYWSYGVFAYGELIVSGSGSLTATGSNGTGVFDSYGVWVADDITVTDDSSLCGVGGNVTVSKDTEYALANSYGVHANNITVTGGSLSGTGGTVTAESSYGDADTNSYGVRAYTDITVTGGSLYSKGGTATATAASTAYSCSYGVYAGNGFTVSSGSLSGTGGDATANGKSAYSNSYGVYTGDEFDGWTYPGNITVNGGTVIGTGGTATATATGTDSANDAASYSCGVMIDEDATEGNITLNGGETIAQGGTAAFSLVPTLGTGMAAYDEDGGVIESSEYTSFTYVRVAAAVSTYPLWVGGVQVTSANAEDVFGNGTATYDPDTNTLTLTNFTYEGEGYTFDTNAVSAAAIYYGGSGQLDYGNYDTLNLVLIGESSVTQSDDSTRYSYGVCAWEAGISVSGTGSLTATSVGSENVIGSYGVEATDITVTGGSLTGVGGAVPEYCENIGVQASLDITVTGGSLTGVGMDSEIGYDSTGVRAYSGSITVSGSGELTGTGGNATNNSTGVYAVSITVSGSGELTGTGGNATNNSTGVYAVNITVSGSGELTGTGGNATGDSETVGHSTGVLAYDIKVFGKGTLTGNSGEADESCGISTHSNIQDYVTVKIPDGGTVKQIVEGEGDDSYSFYVVVDENGNYAKNATLTAGTSYPLWVVGQQFDSDALEIEGAGGKATYDPISNTLTLNNFESSGSRTWNEMYEGGMAVVSYTAAIYYGGSDPLNLVLEGESGVTVPANAAENVICSVGLYSDADISVSGTGSLTVTGGAAAMSGGVMIPNGSLTVTGGSLTGVGSQAESSFGIKVYDSINVEGGSLTGVGGEANSSVGVDASAITVSGGSLTGKSADTAEESYGVWADDITLENNISVVIPEGGVVERITIEEYSYSFDTVMDGETPATEVKLAATYPLWVGGVQVTYANTEDVFGNGTVTYDPDSNTLTLTNFTYEGEGYKNAAIYYDNTSEPLNIELVGENTVIHTGDDSSYSCGVVAEGDLTVSGTGSLTATGGSQGILVTATFENPEFEAADNEATNVLDNPDRTGYALRTSGTSVGNLTITGGSLTATGGSCGVYAEGDLTVSGGGELTGRGGNATGDSTGVAASNITVADEGSSLYGEGGNAEKSLEGFAVSDSYGVYAINIAVSDGGSLSGKGGTASSTSAYDVASALSYGVYAINIAVSDGGILSGQGGDATATAALNAYSYSFGVWATNGFTVTGDDSSLSGEGGTADATGNSAYSYSYGVYTGDESDGNITVTYGGSLSGTGGTASATADGTSSSNDAYSRSCGVMIDENATEGNITVTDGALRGEGGEATVTGGGLVSDSLSTGVMICGSILVEEDGQLSGIGGNLEGEGISIGVYLYEKATGSTETDGNITVTDSARLYGKGGTAEESNGVYSYGSGLVEEYGQLSGEGGNLEGEGISIGVSFSDITVTGGELSGMGGTVGAESVSIGVYLDSENAECTVTGGVLTGMGGTVGAESVSIGVYLDSENAECTVTGGVLTGMGGTVNETEGFSYGVVAGSNVLTLSGGETLAQGDTAAFYNAPNIGEGVEARVFWYDSEEDEDKFAFTNSLEDYYAKEYVRITICDISVGGVKVTGENLSGTGWSYDPESNTLTLTEAAISNDLGEGIKAAGNLIIGGTGSVTGSTYGIYVDGGLTIEEDSVITMTGDVCALAVGSGIGTTNLIVSVPKNAAADDVNVENGEWYTTYGTYETGDEEDVFTPATTVKFEPGYTVYFDTGDSEDWIEPQAVVKGGTVEKPADPTLSGYTFGGWYTDEDCTEAYDFEAAVTEDLWLYAKWTENAPVDDDPPHIPGIPTYTPTIDTVSGGSVTVSDNNPAKGDSVTIIPAPDAGYEVDEVVVTDKNGDPVTVVDNGDGTYSFKQPEGKVNIEVTFKKIVKVCSGDETCPMYPFTDLDRTEWYHDGVHYCIEHGLMQGVGNNAFAPGSTTTRAMIVTILWRLEGSPVVNYAMDFEDVDADQWYTEAIRWAASEKIVEGYGDSKFGTNDAITREQMVTIMFRYAKYKGYDVSIGENTSIVSYGDAIDVAEWAIPAMQWACGSGMIQGIADGDTMNLAPQGNATRAQAAAILQRYCENVANKD